MTFQEVQYFVDTPPVIMCSHTPRNCKQKFCRSSIDYTLYQQEMRERGFKQQKLQLLQDMMGVFRPGILTALIGVSGAGKTTLMDFLSGRKTGGTIEGDIRIEGYPKVQKLFARISGYCEQNDIHSPQITVEESVIYSAWLRLPPQINPETKAVWHPSQIYFQF